MSCQAKHTKFQPSESEWHCPKCGAGADGNDTNGKYVDHEAFKGTLTLTGFSMGFIIDESADASDESCLLLHEEDNCICYTCGYGGSGKSIANKLAKKNDLVPCPCCKGKSMISSKQAKEIEKILGKQEE